MLIFQQKFCNSLVRQLAELQNLFYQLIIRARGYCMDKRKEIYKLGIMKTTT